MEIKKVIENLKHLEKSLDEYAELNQEGKETFDFAISALEFKERYDQFWEEVKTAGMRGEEVEIHHSGRVFRIREVAQ